MLAACALLAAPARADDPGAQTTTVEKRVVSSADDAEEDATGAVSTGSSDLELIHDSTDQTVGMRWSALTIPQGATITAAYIQFSAKESQSVATSLTFQGQAADNPARFQGTANVSTRPRTTASAAWAPVAWNAGETTDNQKTPDLGAIVQEIVNRPGWASGNALVVIVTGTGHRTAWAYDGNAALAPLLHVEYVIGPPPDNPPVAQLAVTQLVTPPLTVTADAAGSTDGDLTPIASYQFDFGDGTPTVTALAPTTTATHAYAAAGSYVVTLVATDAASQTSAPVTRGIDVLAPGTLTTFEKRVAASADDAEETPAGVVTLSSSDLELVHDGVDQTVGMRWTGVPIPHGVAIAAAWIQLSAKESQSEVTSLTLRGEAADHSAAFTSGVASVSARPRTSALAAWSPVPWNAGETTDNQKTPDLTALIQEIVNRPGWQAGNALSVIVTGLGHRTAWAYDGNAAAAPLLHVVYSNTPPPESPPLARLSVALLADPPLGVNADASASTDLDATPIAGYLFDFGDGTPPITTLAASATAQHVYAAAGAYTITLTATDTANLASAPATELVTVGLGNLAPNGTIDEPATSLTVTAGQSVTFRGTAVDPDNSGPVGVLWDFGGAAPNQTLEDPGAVALQVPGVYTVRFAVIDALGLADPTPDTRTIIVNAPSSALADEVHWTILGQTAVTFDWRGGSTTLRYGTTPAYGQIATGVAPSPIPFSSAGPFREAKLTGLAENTLYHYSIGGGPDHTFHTPPPRGASDFTIVTQGDIGASHDWPGVAGVQSRIASLAPDFVLMLGDLTYGSDAGQAAVDGHFNDVMPWSQDAAYQVAWGNHEWDNPAGDDMRNYKGRFDLPNPQTTARAPASGNVGEDWSWFDYGNVRFLGYPEPYSSQAAATRTAPPIAGTPCGLFPPDNVWNTDISTLPVHARSAAWVGSIGGTSHLDVAFGPPNYGMPWVVTDATTPMTSISFTDHSGQSDPGPYPFRPTTPLEQGTGDKHAIMIDESACKLYELFKGNWNGGSPRAGDGAIFDLASNALRPDGWTSADDAGLPIYPGLVRSDEVRAGEIRHALRFTAARTDPTVGSHLWPARFEASYTGITPDPSLPPMGARFRLKASFDLSGYSANAQVILRALQRYGMFLADIGTDWTLGGTAEPFWTDALMNELRTVPGDQFEAVDESSLMIDPNSGQARQPSTVGPWADWSAKAAAIMDQAQADPAIRFIVTFGHRPAYSSGFHPGETELQGIMGALATGHSKYVLNLNGHSHDYERSIPLSGVVHVTAGTGGSALETSGPSCPWLGGCPPPAWSAYRAMHHVVLKLRFTGDAIDGTALCGPADPRDDLACADGTILDTFHIPDRPPVAALAATPPTGNAPLTVSLSAAGASDPDGPIATYTFDFGDGATAGPQATPTASHAYAMGEWVAKVVVADAEGLADSTTARILVADPANPNLALNGSFEIDAGGWSALGNAALGTTDGGFDGARSALVTAGGAAPFGLTDDPGWILSVPQGGVRYDVEAWVRSSTGTGQIQLAISEYLGGAEVNAPTTTVPFALGTGWQRLRTSFLTCCTGSQVRLQIVDVPIHAGEAFEVDNVSIGTALGPTGTGGPAPLGEARAWVAPIPMRETGTLHFVNTRPGLATANLYDASGRLVRRWLDRQWIPAGRHQVLLDGHDAQGERLRSGVYLYKVVLPGRVVTGRVLIVR